MDAEHSFTDHHLFLCKVAQREQEEQQACVPHAVLTCPYHWVRDLGVGPLLFLGRMLRASSTLATTSKRRKTGDEEPSAEMQQFVDRLLGSVPRLCTSLNAEAQLCGMQRKRFKTLLIRIGPLAYLGHRLFISSCLSWLLLQKQEGLLDIISTALVTKYDETPLHLRASELDSGITGRRPVSVCR